MIVRIVNREDPDQCEERGGSVVECLTGDRGIAVSRLTRDTVLCP